MNWQQMNEWRFRTLFSFVLSTLTFRFWFPCIVRTLTSWSPSAAKGVTVGISQSPGGCVQVLLLDRQPSNRRDAPPPLPWLPYAWPTPRVHDAGVVRHGPGMHVQLRRHVLVCHVEQAHARFHGAHLYRYEIQALPNRRRTHLGALSPQFLKGLKSEFVCRLPHKSLLAHVQQDLGSAQTMGCSSDNSAENGSGHATPGSDSTKNNQSFN
jgi:hypothetical protein